MDIIDKLKELARTRDLINTHKDKANILNQELQNSSAYIRYQNELNNVRGLEQQESVLANDIREIAVQIFDGINKKSIQGIEIKEFSTITVGDEKKALAWAAQNAPSILKYDQSKFKKAVENLELDFIEKGIEYKAQISSDLSAYLDK